MAKNVLSDDLFNSRLRGVLNQVNQIALRARYNGRGQNLDDSSAIIIDDGETSVEAWILRMEEALAQVRTLATSKDKHYGYLLLQIAAMAVNCMIYALALPRWHVSGIWPSISPKEWTAFS